MKKKLKKSEGKKAGIFIIFLVLLVAVIVIVNSVFFNEKSVNNDPKIEDIAQCNIKAGGIRVGDKCFNCGDADGICPEDFGAVCKIKDPDCS